MGIGGTLRYIGRLVFFFSSRRRHTRCSRDWSSDVCSSDLGAHEDLFEHSVLPVEPELGPRICASVDDRQRHGTGGEEQRVADDPTVPDFERWYDSVQPEPLHEDEEEWEDQLEKQRCPVEIRSQIAIDESQVDVHPKPLSVSRPFSSSVTMWMNASSRVVS